MQLPKITTALLIPMCLHLSSHEASSATMLSLTANGQITSIADLFGEFQGVNMGDRFSAQVTYDASTSDTILAADQGNYKQDIIANPALRASITIHRSIGDLTFTTQSNFSIAARMFLTEDNIQIASMNPGIFADPRIDVSFLIPVLLVDSSATALSTDSFPAGFLSSGAMNLSPFNRSQMLLQYVDNDTLTVGSLVGNITSIVVIPEPSTFVSICLTAICSLFRRVRR